MRKFLKICAGALKLACFILLSLLLIIGAAEVYTNAMANAYCHQSPADCRQGDVGLVLGCSKLFSKGKPSPYFEGRINAASRLWKSGKLRCIIVSGDHREKYYNEPRDMKQALIKRGVPEHAIVCDFAGLRTYDSVYRARHIFGASSITIISQGYHVKRAVATARQLGIDAEGFCAAPIAFNRPTLIRQFLRERAARVAMVFDLIIGEEPRHMGDPVALPL
jgi:SanA protein